MNHSDIAALMKGAAPAIRDYVAAAVKPLADRIAELERQVAATDSVDSADAIRAAVADAVAALPAAIDGKDADPSEIARLVSDAVAALPPAEQGQDADPEEIRAMVAEAVEALPAPAPGKDADMGEVARLIEEAVQRAVAVIEPRGPEVGQLRDLVAEAVSKLPAPENGKDAAPLTEAEFAAILEPILEARFAEMEKPQDGKSVTLEELRPLVDETVSAALAEAAAAIPAPKDGAPGKDGADGKLPLVKSWEDRVHYVGEVVTLDGSTFQAQRDTGRAPPHADWVCIASAGRDGSDGADGRSLRVRGTYIDVGEYLALDIVALNGASFIAKKDEPGQCPGEDWQLIAAQGKRGAPGEGRKGDPGRPGLAGEAVVAAAISNQGMLTLTNGDGTTVDCDLYPLLRKLASTTP